MSNRKNIMDVRELLLHVRAGSSNRQIAQDMCIDRRTEGRHRKWTAEQGLLEGPLPPRGDPPLVERVEEDTSLGEKFWLYIVTEAATDAPQLQRIHNPVEEAGPVIKSMSRLSWS